MVLILVVVDDGLVPNDELHTYARSTVLILVVVDDGLVPICIGSYSFGSEVLILVVVDDGLVPVVAKAEELGIRGLNPCCSGRWSSTGPNSDDLEDHRGLNPCCSGRWSSTLNRIDTGRQRPVLILVVVDDGLVLDLIRHY